MSDLQCAARLVVVNPPGLTDVAWLASAVHLEKIQAVYAADDVPDTGPVESLADDLGVPSHLGHGDLHGREVKSGQTVEEVASSLCGF